MAGNIQISQITNANCYINGSSLLGLVEEAKSPDVVAKVAEYTGLGLMSSFELPVGFEKMETELKFKSYSADLMKQVGNLFTTQQLQFRANLEGWEGGSGRVSQKGLLTFMEVIFKKVPTGTTYKAQGRAEFSATASVLKFKQVLDGVEMIEIDVLNNIFKVGGEDMLIQYRANLGL
jgi:P2 family phage contractile tail tube protein